MMLLKSLLLSFILQVLFTSYYCNSANNEDNNDVHSSKSNATSNSSSNSNSENKRENLLVTLFGKDLYKWSAHSNNPSGSSKEIEEVDTIKALGNKKVIGIYFSASWCGPCKYT